MKKLNLVSIIIVLALLGYVGFSQLKPHTGFDSAIAPLHTPSATDQVQTTPSETTPLDDVLLSQPQSLAGSFLAGRAASNANDWSAASRYFSAAYGFDPNNALLFEQALISLINNGQINDARALIKAVRDEATAQQVTLNFTLPAQQLMVLLDVFDAVQTKNWQAAEKLLPDYLAQGFGQYLKPFLQTWVLVGQGRTAEAHKILQASLAEKPALRHLYYIHLALLAENAGQITQAEKFYMRALQTNVSIRSVWLASEFYLRQNQPQKAIKLAEELQEALPTSPLPAFYLDYLKKPNVVAVQQHAPDPVQGLTAVLFDLASVLQQEASARVALLYAQLARHLSPNDAFVQMLTGDLFTADRFFDEAQTYYQAVPSTHPLFVLSQLRAAQTLEEDKKIDQAVAVLQKLAAIPSVARRMNEELGDVWRRAEQFDKALPYYDAAIAAIKKPTVQDWPVFFGRGMCYERLKNWAKAEPDLQQALDLDPENAQVLNYLGYSWADQGHNLDKAHDLVEAALEQTPNDPYILDSMGWVLYRMGEFDAAIEYLEEAAADLSSDPVINDHLGDAYWRANRVSEAKVQWQRALSTADKKTDADLIKKLEQKLVQGI